MLAERQAGWPRGQDAGHLAKKRGVWGGQGNPIRLGFQSKLCNRIQVRPTAPCLSKQIQLREGEGALMASTFGPLCSEDLQALGQRI